MNKKTLRTLTTLSLGTALALVAAGCATMSPYTAAPMKQEATGTPTGEKVREAQVGGYQVSYYLLDMGAAVAPKTKHLMVFLTTPDGKEVSDAAVSYKITGPGTEVREVTTYRGNRGEFTYKVYPDQSTLKAISMSGGYGADVQLREKGEYKVATKVTVGAISLADGFGYTVK